MRLDVFREACNKIVQTHAHPRRSRGQHKALDRSVIYLKSKGSTMSQRLGNIDAYSMSVQIADKTMNRAALAGIARHQDSPELGMLSDDAEDVLEFKDLNVGIGGAFAFS